MDSLEIKFLLNYMEHNREHLPSLQHQFIVSLKKHYKSTGVLTKRQVECLYLIRKNIPSLEEAVYESESDKYPAQYSSIDCMTPFNM